MARTNDLDLKFLDVAYHRNGVSGDSFYVVLFEDADEGRLIAVLPSEAIAGEDQEPRCYVLNVDLLEKGVVAFVANSYRGDRYYQAVAAAAQAYEADTFESGLPAEERALVEDLVEIRLDSSPLARPSALAERARTS